MKIFRRILLVVFILLIAIPSAFQIAGALREQHSNKEMAPTTGHFVFAHDVDMFIQESGLATDPAVIIIHGTGAWSETWRKTLTALAAAHFHGIAIDLPPFGYSSRPHDVSYSRHTQALRILGVLDALKIKKAVFMGHSFGARATITAALKSPDRVQQLVLVDAALGLETNSLEDRSPATVSEPTFVDHLLETSWIRSIIVSSTLGNPLLTRKFIAAFMYKPESVTDEILATYQKPMNLKGNTDNVGLWLQDFLSSGDTTLLSDVKQLGAAKIATSIIWGDKDSITPLWQGEMLKKMFLISKLRTMEGVGHIPQLEATEEFNKILLEELKP